MARIDWQGELHRLQRLELPTLHKQLRLRLSQATHYGDRRGDSVAEWYFGSLADVWCGRGEHDKEVAVLARFIDARLKVDTRTIERRIESTRAGICVRLDTPLDDGPHQQTTGHTGWIDKSGGEDKP